MPTNSGAITASCELVWDKDNIFFLPQDHGEETTRSQVLLYTTQMVPYHNLMYSWLYASFCWQFESCDRYRILNATFQQACIQAVFMFSLCTQMLMSGPHGSMSITREAVETMSSWRQFVFTTAPECVKTHVRLKPELLNGFQSAKLGRRSMRTPLWVSGASMRSRVQIETAPIMQFVSSVPKVLSCNKIDLSAKSYCQYKKLYSEFVHQQSHLWLEIFLEIREKNDDGSHLHSRLTGNSVNIQGTWDLWSVWSTCPALCGQVGVQVRTRTCQSQSTPCTGPKVEGKECNGPECPKTGEINPLLFLYSVVTWISSSNSGEFVQK